MSEGAPLRTPMAWASGGRTRCLYCGGSSAWWDCACFRADEVRKGKRAKPRVLHRGGRMVIVLDAEAAAHNAIGMEPYRPELPEIADEATLAAEEAVVLSTVGADRKRYKIEWMRKKREADRAARENQEKTDG